MDTYLPADFHILHDAAPQDWRDVSTTQSSRSATQTQTDGPAIAVAVDLASRCVDPSWQTL